jgi:hypothetical protein
LIRRILILCVFSFVARKGLTQDIVQTINNAKRELKQPVSVNGSIGANSVFYRVTGIPPRRDPFYWVINANLTFLLFNKISVPFSAMITQQDKNYSNGLDKFSQPFNQFGMSPSYKGITLHLGFRSLEFSEYTLSGALFLGAGIEIKPQHSNYSIAGLYGRFVKAIPTGGIDGIVVSVPAYERVGGGAKVKFGTEQNCGELIFLKIRDNVNSIPFDTGLTITPQENEMLSVGTQQRVNKWFRCSGNLSLSMFTRNLYEAPVKLERFTYLNEIYDPRPSSQFNKAINIGLDFMPGKLITGLKYKRIDPDYRSLGAAFLTNDIEEISANAAFQMFKNKMNIIVGSGIQKNNLDHVQILTSRRIIGSANISCNINPHLNLGFNYSNFSSNSFAVRDAFTDSIRLVQLTQNGSSSLNYSFGKYKVKHAFCLITTYQESGGNQQITTTFLNGTANYSLMFNEIGLSINAAVMYNRSSNGPAGVNEGMGPNCGLQKSFRKNKLRIYLNGGIQHTFLNGDDLTRNLFNTFGLTYTFDKNQSFKVDGTYSEKTASRPGVVSFSEMRGNIGYLYTFCVKPKSAK